jgi:hypothetical protein
VAGTSTGAAVSAHDLDHPMVGWSKHNEGLFMMNHTDGWMNGWMGGGMWLWSVVGVLLVVLLAVLIGRMAKK